MSQLNKTQFELTSKVLAIEEGKNYNIIFWLFVFIIIEKREMRKKIDEMK